MPLKNNKTNTVEYLNIDWFRLIAALLVITIHTSPLTSFSDTADFILTRIIARTAVPFFFMASGFFLIPESKSVMASVKKLVGLYLLAILLYLPLNIYSGQQVTNFGDGLRAVFFDGTFYHLWYMPAAILGILLLAAMRRFLSLKGCLIVCCILYVIGLGGDSYYGLVSQLPPLKVFYDGIFVFSSYTRNGIFLAPVFLCLGWFIGSQKMSAPVKPKRFLHPRISFIWPMILFLVLMAVEALILRFLDVQRHDSMYIFLLPCMYCLFSWLACKTRGRADKARGEDGKARGEVSKARGEVSKARSEVSKARGEVSKARGRAGNFISGIDQRRLGAMLRSVSLSIYILHPWVIVAVRGAAKILHLEKLLVDQSFIHFIAVAIGSCIMAVILWICKQIFIKKYRQRQK